MPANPKSPLNRYVAFFEGVAKTGRVWMLEEGGEWIHAVDKKLGMTFVPVWPTMRAAKDCVRGVWARCKPVPIEARQLRRLWKPRQLVRQKRGVAVFPTADDDGFRVNASLFDSDLGYAIGSHD